MEAREHIEGFAAEREAAKALRHELAVVDPVLEQRRELAITAARISPPTNVKAELGERLERYRQEHGVKDPSRALGSEAKRGADQARQEATRRRLQEIQRVLGLGHHGARARQLGRGSGISR